MAKGDRQELWQVVEREGLEKPIWIRIGSAFENSDGSYSLLFDCFPAGNGNVQMRKPFPKEEQQPQAPANNGPRPRNNGRNRS